MRLEANGEVQEALNKLTKLTSADGSKRLVDPAKIALMGHSFGGLVVTIAASQDLRTPPAVTLNLSGGALSWHQTEVWEDEMTDYARAHRMPLYLQQAMNESSAGVSSTLQPFLKANLTGAAQMSVFSDAHWDTAWQSFCDAQDYGPNKCAHVWFFSEGNQVDRWWPSAFAFMTRHGVK